MGYQSVELKGKKRRNHEDSVRRNREAIAVKKALVETYEQMDLKPPAELIHNLLQKRTYLKNQTGENE